MIWSHARWRTMHGFMRGFGNQIIATYAVLEHITVLETVRVALLTFTVLDAAQDDRKEA